LLADLFAARSHPPRGPICHDMAIQKTLSGNAGKNRVKSRAQNLAYTGIYHGTHQ